MIAFDLLGLYARDGLPVCELLRRDAFFESRIELKAAARAEWSGGLEVGRRYDAILAITGGEHMEVFPSSELATDLATGKGDSKALSWDSGLTLASGENR